MFEFNKMPETFSIRKFLIYVFIGVSSINLLLYLGYYVCSPAFQSRDVVFLYKITEGWYPFYGFYLCFIPTIITVIGTFFATRISNLYLQELIVGIGFLIAMLFSLTFIPVSITIGMLYIGITSVVLVVILFRHKDFGFPETTPLNEVKDPHEQDIIVESIKLSRETLLALFRDLFLIIVVYLVIGGASLIISQYKGVAELFSPEQPFAIIFFRLQTVYSFFFLIYFALGLFAWTTYYIYRKLLDLIKQLKISE